MTQAWQLVVQASFLGGTSEVVMSVRGKGNNVGIDLCCRIVVGGGAAQSDASVRLVLSSVINPHSL